MKKQILFLLLCASAVFGVFGEMYKANVEASYYADKFHGRKTANGEIFNMYDFTAAHKSLPFNSILKVTNISNGKSVTVRVNDRGPFVAGREIDLSKAAAQKLDMIGSGTAKVSIEILQRGAETAISTATAKKAGESAGANVVSSKPKTTAPSEAAPSSSKINEEVAVLKEEAVKDLRWDIQVGSFGERANAEALAQKLLKSGFKNVVYQKGEGITRVVLRDIPTANVQGFLNQLEEKGFKDYLVKRRA